jgi:hypothetical protein
MLPLPSAGLALGANTDGPSLVAGAAAATMPVAPPQPAWLPWPPDANAAHQRSASAAGSASAPPTAVAVQAALRAAAVAGDPGVYAALLPHVQARLQSPEVVQAGLQQLALASHLLCALASGISSTVRSGIWHLIYCASCCKATVAMGPHWSARRPSWQRQPRPPGRCRPSRTRPAARQRRQRRSSALPAARRRMRCLRYMLYMRPAARNLPVVASGTGPSSSSSAQGGHRDDALAASVSRHARRPSRPWIVLLCSLSEESIMG